MVPSCILFSNLEPGNRATDEFPFLKLELQARTPQRHAELHACAPAVRADFLTRKRISTVQGLRPSCLDFVTFVLSSIANGSLPDDSDASHRSLSAAKREDKS